MSLFAVALLDAQGVLPEPLTASPEYEDRAAVIRAHLSHGAPVVRWLPVPPEARTDPGATFGTLGDHARLLDVHTYAGPAPYVGDPFVYAWRVALDDSGGYVAGPARAEYLTPDPTVLGGHPTVGPLTPKETP